MSLYCKGSSHFHVKFKYLIEYQVDWCGDVLCTYTLHVPEHHKLSRTLQPDLSIKCCAGCDSLANNTQVSTQPILDESHQTKSHFDILNVSYQSPNHTKRSLVSEH